MALELPTLAAIEAQVQAIWQSYRPNASFSKLSDLWLYQKVVGRLVYRLHQSVGRALDAIFPTTTYGDYANAWAVLLGCVDHTGTAFGRIEASTSEGTNALAVVTSSGTPTVNDGDQLTDAAGNVYEVTETHAFTHPETYNMDVASIDTGSAMNLKTGDVLTFSSPPAGIVAASSLVADLSGGTDREGDSALRARLKAKLSTPSLSGNWAHWVEVIENASPGELDAFVWPARNNSPTGYGTVDYMAIKRNSTGTDKHIAAADALYTAIDAAVTANMPVQQMLQSRQLTVVAVEAGVNIEFTLADWALDADKCDWDAQDGAFHVDAASDPNITADADVTGHLAVGDRVVINGAQAIVDGLSIGADDKVFSVSTWFDEEDDDLNPFPWAAGYDPTTDGAGPGGGAWIYSGGGLVMDLITAFVGPGGFYDQRGPAAGTYAAPITGWVDSITQLSVQTEAINTGDGKIVDVTVTTPSSDLTPGYGSGATVERYVPADISFWEVK